MNNVIVSTCISCHCDNFFCPPPGPSVDTPPPPPQDPCDFAPCACNPSGPGCGGGGGSGGSSTGGSSGDGNGGDDDKPKEDPPERDCDDGIFSAENKCETPCEKIRNNIFRLPWLQTKLEDLVSKTNLKHESGFWVDKDNGSGITPIGKDGKSVTFPAGPNKKWVFHVHTDKFKNGKRDINPETREIEDQFDVPHKVFSPQDIVSTLNRVLVTQNATFPQFKKEAVTIGLITSENSYFFKFDGEVSEITKKFPSLVNDKGLLKLGQKQNKFLEGVLNKLIKDDGVEKGFLNFQKQYFNIEGLKLYRSKIKKSGTNFDKLKIKEIKLSPDGKKVVRTDC